MSRYRYEPGSKPIDGYTIQYALGHGGFGEVYFAISDAGREVALKVIQNYEETELRGIRDCMNLKSSHLVTIFDVKFASDGVPWVIMEYVAGPSLREILDESPKGLSGPQAAYIVREITRGLSDLHQSGVVHRDLKPHNIFLENGTVKIGDYSLSKSMAPSHRSGHTTTVGSVHYMAPEIGMGRYDQSVDIYALGVILYELLTGQPPYQGESVGEVLMKHLQSSPDVSSLPGTFAAVVSKAMHRDPKARYQSVHELAAELVTESGSVTSHTISPLSISMIDTPVREVRRRKAKAEFSDAETFAAPVSLQDTETSDPTPVPLSWMPPLFQIEGAIAERFAFTIIASCVTFLMLLVGVFSSKTQVSPADTVAFAFYIMISVFTARWLYRIIPICRNDSKFAHTWFASLIRRAVSLVPVGIAYATLANWLTYGELNEIDPSVAAIAWSMVLIDWILLVSPRRPHRIAILPTLAIGVIGAIASYIDLGDEDQLAFGAAIAMSTAVALQLISPIIWIQDKDTVSESVSTGVSPSAAEAEKPESSIGPPPSGLSSESGNVSGEASYS